MGDEVLESSLGIVACHRPCERVESPGIARQFAAHERHDLTRDLIGLESKRRGYRSVRALLAEGEAVVVVVVPLPAHGLRLAFGVALHQDVEAGPLLPIEVLHREAGSTIGPLGKGLVGREEVRVGQELERQCEGAGE